MAHETDLPTAGWIALGLALSIVPRATAESPKADVKERHWAFQPVERPDIPAVTDPGWSRNPIDRFVLARMEAEGIKPVGVADRRTLIRRLYFDLIGIPPTPDEIRTFVDDSRPTPSPGLSMTCWPARNMAERWARHWLDVVRYAETNGYERDGDKPHAWRYRDYVIDAFNQDKPYNRFLVEQLAGDEVEGSNAVSSDRHHIYAAGYLGR